MNFIYFNGLLLFAGFPAALVFSVGVMACMLPLVPFLKNENPPKAVVFPVMTLAGGFQIYFWGLWAAFCVAVILKFTHKPEVTWDWLYWVCGFMWCTSLIGWFAHKEKMMSTSVEEVHRIEKGTNFYSLIAIGAFVLFAFSPSLANWPYGWFMQLMGFSKYMSG